MPPRLDAPGEADEGLQRLLAEGAVPAEADAEEAGVRLSAPRHGGGGHETAAEYAVCHVRRMFTCRWTGRTSWRTGKGQAVARYPLHTLQGIVSFAYAGASPALMGACAQREIGLAFCTPRGRFLARACGRGAGKRSAPPRRSIARRTTRRESCRIARNMIFGKVYNARWSVERTRRDHALRIDAAHFAAVSAQLQGAVAADRSRRRRWTGCGGWRASVRRRISACWMR